VLKCPVKFSSFPTVREGEKRSTLMPAVLTIRGTSVPACLDDSNAQQRCPALKAI